MADSKYIELFLEQLSFQLWGVTDDPLDIKDGEFPINERLGGPVKGMLAAVGAAEAAMRGDPGLIRVLLVPTMANPYCGQLTVRRSRSGDALRPNLSQDVPGDNNLKELIP